MAEIVFGVGTSHSPLLATEPEQWDLRADDDRKNPAHPFRGNVYTFDDLMKLRKGENLGTQNTIDVRRANHVRNQTHLDFLGQKIKEADLDVLVIFGDDQREILLQDISPPFMVFTGDKVPFMPTTPERFEKMPKGVQVADWARTPERDMWLKGAPDLAVHLVNEVRTDFDVAVSDTVIEKEGGERGVGHAFGFYYHRLLDDLIDTPRMATLPIFINTFFPPNQPPIKRVLEFGRSVGRAIRSWDKDVRVGIAASGGLSHFVIDEELDQRMIDALKAGDEAAILAEPENHFQSGSSEIKNWVAAMAALDGTGLKFQLVDYVPCYRSEAGTGNAMCFGLWR